MERTGQQDNWEPNDTMDRAYYARNDKTLYRAFISSASDVDFFRVGTPHCGSATVKAPVDVNLHIRLYGAVDRDSDGNPDVLAERDVSAGQTESVYCSETPNSTGLGDYWLEVFSADGSYSPVHPYWANLRVNY